VTLVKDHPCGVKPLALSTQGHCWPQLSPQLSYQINHLYAWPVNYCYVLWIVFFCLRGLGVFAVGMLYQPRFYMLILMWAKHAKDTTRALVWSWFLWDLSALDVVCLIHSRVGTWHILVDKVVHGQTPLVRQKQTDKQLTGGASNRQLYVWNAQNVSKHKLFMVLLFASAGPRS